VELFAKCPFIRPRFVPIPSELKLPVNALMPLWPILPVLLKVETFPVNVLIPPLVRDPLIVWCVCMPEYVPTPSMGIVTAH
jgi:hypothetical protein